MLMIASLTCCVTLESRGTDGQFFLAPYGPKLPLRFRRVMPASSAVSLSADTAGESPSGLHQALPISSESPGLCPQRWVPWVCSPRAAAAEVGQGSPEHRTQRSLADLFCRVSTARNRNPLFSLKAGMNDANAACRRACTGGSERERLHFLCLQTYRKSCKPRPPPGPSLIQGDTRALADCLQTWPSERPLQRPVA